MWPEAELDKVMVMLQEAHSRMLDGHLTRTKCEELSQVVGLHYVPTGLLACERLRGHCHLLGVVTYDWVHSLLQDGVFVIEAALLVKAVGMIAGVQQQSRT